MGKFNSVKVNTKRGRSTRDLSFDHVTSTDFNVVKPIAIYEAVPNDVYHIKPEIWLRTQAMNCPTFGKMDVITRAFFVPLRLTWKHFYDFYRKEPVTMGQQLSAYDYIFENVPRVGVHELWERFNVRFSSRDEEGFLQTSNVPMDFYSGTDPHLGLTYGIYCQETYYVDGADYGVNHQANFISYKFNLIGKRVWDLLHSLGYRAQMNSQTSTTSYNSGNAQNDYMVSILPLVSWLKMFQDWYCPTEYKYLFRHDFLGDWDGTINNTLIDNLFSELSWAVFIFFNDDIFSLCENAPYQKGTKSINMYIDQNDHEPNTLLRWDDLDKRNPVKTNSKFGADIDSFSPVSISSTATAVQLKGTNIFRASNQSSNNPMYTENDVSTNAEPLNAMVSNWSVRAVVRTAEWLQRNNLLSGRVTEYLKAKFGSAPTAARMDVTEYIGSASSPIRIQDIAGTADANLAELGAKGTCYNIDNLNYTAEEFGYILITIELRPRIGYGQGVDPLVLRTRLTEFYDQEFDALGFEPVPTQTLVGGQTVYAPSGSGASAQNFCNLNAHENRIFGYLPRMWSYKIKHDNLSGDFCIPKNQNADIQSFHLMRSIHGSDIENFVHNSLTFRYAGLTYYMNDYQRIFASGSYNLSDHFQLICSFDTYVNGDPLALSESWQVNAEHDEREGHMTTIQGSL